MHQFLKKSTIFTIVYIFFNYSLNYVDSKFYQNYKFDEGSVIFVGNSHTRSAINPKLISGSYNISLDAEPLIASFWKIKNIINNCGIDTIIFGLSHVHLSALIDDSFSASQSAGEMFERYYSIIDIDFIDRVKFKLARYYYIYLKNMMLFYQNNHHEKYIGKYKPLDKKVVDFEKNINETIYKHYYKDNSNAAISQTSISYLDSIVNICHVNEVELIVVSTPVHEKYYQKVPDKILNEYKFITRSLVKRDVRVIDYSRLYKGNTLFADADHLSEEGSHEFTKLLKSIF